MKIRFCPKCKSTENKFWIGGKAGIYVCKKCGYKSAIFPEKIIKVKE